MPVACNGLYNPAQELLPASTRIRADPGGSRRGRSHPWGFLGWPSRRAICSRLSVGTGQCRARWAARLWCWAAELPGTTGLGTALQAVSQALRAVLGLKAWLVWEEKQPTSLLPCSYPFAPLLYAKGTPTCRNKAHLVIYRAAGKKPSASALQFGLQIIVQRSHEDQHILYHQLDDL